MLFWAIRYMFFSVYYPSVAVKILYSKPGIIVQNANSGN